MPNIGRIICITETNADGCGTDICVCVRFHQPVIQSDIDLFRQTLAQVKAECIAQAEPYDTLEDLVSDGIEIFQCLPTARSKGLSAEVIAPVPDFDFEIEI